MFSCEMLVIDNPLLTGCIYYMQKEFNPAWLSDTQ